MKCNKVVFALALSFSSYAAIAENNDTGAITVNAFLESTGIGASAQYKLLDDWSARIEFAQQNDIDASRYGVDALYHIDNSPVYALIGVKQVDTLDSTTLANIGAGVTHKINHNWGMLLETTWYEGLSESYTDVTMKFGISYTFGGSSQTAKRPQATPMHSDSASQNNAGKIYAANYALTDATSPSSSTNNYNKNDIDNDGVINAHDICPNTPTEDAVDNQGCSRYEDRKISISLIVNFPHNDHNIKNQYFDSINKVAIYLEEHPNAVLSIEGHASVIGETNYNLALSKRRANTIAEILVQRYDISPQRIKTVGYGDSSPLNANDTHEAHAQNRRVEIFNTSNVRVKVKRVDSNVSLENTSKSNSGS